MSRLDDDAMEECDGCGNFMFDCTCEDDMSDDSGYNDEDCLFSEYERIEYIKEVSQQIFIDRLNIMTKAHMTGDATESPMDSASFSVAAARTLWFEIEKQMRT